mgnify:CR=1 FL=1
MGEQMKSQMTKEEYDAFIKQKRQELFDIKFKIALAVSEAEKVSLKEEEGQVKKALVRAMQSSMDYGYYDKKGGKGR